MIKKRGEITTQQIVSITILVVSVAILLYFLFQLDWGNTSKSDICHDSVARLSKFGQKAIGVSALECRTEYVCISGGEDCEGTIDRTEDVSLSQDVDKNKEEIFSAISKEMANCWWMYGEGNADYSGESSGNGYCAICSVLVFDSEIKSKLNSPLNLEEFGQYLDSAKADSTQTYLGYFAIDGAYDLSLYKGTMDFTKEYAIVTGVTDVDKKIVSSSTFTPMQTQLLEKSKTAYNNFGCEHFVSMS